VRANSQGAAARYDIGSDPKNDDVHIAWKYTWTAKDTWLGPQQNLGSIGSLYCLTMDPFEKYDMIFNGAMSSRMQSHRLVSMRERTTAGSWH